MLPRRVRRTIDVRTFHIGSHYARNFCVSDASESKGQRRFGLDNASLFQIQGISCNGGRRRSKGLHQFPRCRHSFFSMLEIRTLRLTLLGNDDAVNIAARWFTASTHINLNMKQLFLLSAICVLCGCSVFHRAPPNASVRKSLGRNEMTEFVERKTRLHNIWIERFQRDTHGQKLFINFSFRQGNEEKCQTAIVTSYKFSVVEGAPSVFYNDAGEPKTRLIGCEARYEADGRLFYHYEDAYYECGNGARMPHDDMRGMLNLTGSEGVLIQLKGGGAWKILGLANQREPMLDPPPHLDVPCCASLQNCELVIFGRSKLPHDDYGVACLVYHETSSGYRLVEEIPLPWANSVYDFDADSGRALITGQAQMFAGYYQFNIRTKHRVLLGFAPSDNVLFLSPDVVRTLK